MTEPIRFQIPVHPLGFTLSWAVTIFEGQGWRFMGTEYDKSEDITWAKFEENQNMPKYIRLEPDQVAPDCRVVRVNA